MQPSDVGAEMKILHVIPSLGRGGAERQLRDVIVNTASAEFKHVVCLFGGADDFARDIIAAGQEVVCLNVEWRHKLTAARRIASEIRRTNPDILHTWLFEANFVTRIAHFTRRSSRVVTSLQNPDYEPDAIEAAGWSRPKMALRRAFDTAFAFIGNPWFVACARFVEDSAKRRLYIPDARIRTIYNSFDEMTLTTNPDDRERIRRELSFGDDDLVFCIVGRLTEQKGHSVLLAALHQLADVHKARLMIVGRGALEPVLRSECERLGLSSRVRFVGVRPDIGAYLEASDAFVFPTLFEGFGIALVEAMSKGLPCIASRVGPIPEIITHERDGLLVEPSAVEALASAMRRVANDPGLRRSLGDAARSSAARFSSATIMPHWKQFYREVARPSKVSF
jgi:glycosyltransferase involved in cell wall biosynthesis